MTIFCLVPIVIFTLIASRNCIRVSAEKRPEWMSFIPDGDLQTVLTAQTAARNSGIHYNDAAPFNKLDEDLFQGDLRGCSYIDDPPCPPVKTPLRWRRNIFTSQILIQYMVSASLSYMVDLILRAHQNIENQTCLVFDENIDNVNHYVTYMPGDRCAADWGGSDKSELLITINNACVDGKVGNIQNLLMQSLGFRKEHTRRDRDMYIKIYWDNVIPGAERAFKVDGKDVTYDYPYDYDSVLHPNYFFLAKSPFAPTITASSKVAIGQRTGLSRFDVLKLNRLFCGEKSAIRSASLVTVVSNANEQNINLPTRQPMLTEIPTVTVSALISTSLITTEANKALNVPLNFSSTKQSVHGSRKVKKRNRTITTTAMTPPPLEDEISLTSTIENISPTPTLTRPCSGSESWMTSLNLQTYSRTVFDGRTTVWEQSTTRSTRYWSAGPTDFIESLLAQSPEYPEFQFDSPVMMIKTKHLSDAVLTLHTKYQPKTLLDGRIFHQEKLETRSLQCGK